MTNKEKLASDNQKMTHLISHYCLATECKKCVLQEECDNFRSTKENYYHRDCFAYATETTIKEWFESEAEE